MGCDIHGYIEYKKGNGYQNFSYGRFGSRDYEMFGLLAGVRCDGCVFEPRGIPKDIGWFTKDEYTLFVFDDVSDFEDGVCSKESADRWIEQGSSEYWEGDKQRITHPDWHTPSWLSADEFEVVLNKRKENNDWYCSPIWDGVLAAMKSLPNSRFVFWFDN